MNDKTPNPNDWDVSKIEETVEEMFRGCKQPKPIDLTLGENQSIEVDLQCRGNGIKILYVKLDGAIILRASTQRINIQLCELSFTG